MAVTVDHPEVKYVYPLHFNSVPSGEKPRMRHHLDCGHFAPSDGTVLGKPKLATEKQMQTLRACQDCVETESKPSGHSRLSDKGEMLGRDCPVCNQVMPLTGVCDNCAY